MSMSTPVCAHLNYALHDLQNMCTQTKVGTILKFGGRCDVHEVFSVEETTGVFTTNLSMRDVGFAFHKSRWSFKGKSF